MKSLMFVFLAIISEGVYATFHKLTGPLIHPILGGGIIGLTAFLVALSLLGLNNNNIIYSQKGVIFATIIGLSAFGIDAATLAVYRIGLPLHIGGPLIIGGGIVLITLISFLWLGEDISFLKGIGILFILIGGILLFE